MEHINATNARKNLYALIGNANRDSIPVHISSPKGNVVLVSEDDWNAMQETLHLYSVPGLVQSILEAKNAPEEECTAYDPKEEW